MKRHLPTIALACAFAAGLATASFAQTNPSGGSGAGSVSGAKSDTSGANPSNKGTAAGTISGGGSMGHAKSMGKGSAGKMSH